MCGGLPEPGIHQNSREELKASCQELEKCRLKCNKRRAPFGSVCLCLCVCGGGDLVTHGLNHVIANSLKLLSASGASNTSKRCSVGLELNVCPANTLT